ncbi:213_t:CDS:2, partial [Acaulospora colombiana]
HPEPLQDQNEGPFLWGDPLYNRFFAHSYSSSTPITLLTPETLVGMRVFLSIYPLACLAVLVSALVPVHDSNALVVNENNLVAPDSVIEVLDTVQLGGGGDDDPEEECDVGDDDVEGKFARNDPQAAGAEWFQGQRVYSVSPIFVWAPPMTILVDIAASTLHQ